MIILGLNTHHADSSAAIFVDGKLILDFFADESIRKNTVSKRGEMPVIDLTGKKIVETFGKYSHFEAIYKNRNSEKTITIKPIK